MPDLPAHIEEMASINSESERCHNDTKGYLKITEKVGKSLPLKHIKQTHAIFENIAWHRAHRTPGVLKLSVDVKDKVKVDQLCRKGYCRRRQKVKALDKDQL